MKVSQISLIIGLSMLLNFNPSIVWADKKTAIIAGSAGGGAVAAIGGALWYKLRNSNRKILVEVDGEPLNIDINNENKLSQVLSKKGFDENLIKETKLKIFHDIKKYTNDGQLENIKFIIKKKNGTTSIETKVNSVSVDEKPVFLNNKEMNYVLDLKYISKKNLDNFFGNGENEYFYTNKIREIKNALKEEMSEVDLREPTLAEVSSELIDE